MRHRTKFREDRLNRSGDIADFRFFKMAAAAILDFGNFKFLTVGTLKRSRVCVSLCITQHTAVLIIFSVILQTSITAQMMSIGGDRGEYQHAQTEECFTYHSRGNSHFLSSGISYADSIVTPSDIHPLICGTSCASSGAVDSLWLTLYIGLFFIPLSKTSALSCIYNALVCIDTMRSLMGNLCAVQ